MGGSIPEYFKKINSLLSFSDLLSLTITALIALLLMLYSNHSGIKNGKELVYRAGDTKLAILPKSGIFGSRNGKTYTYSWCSGSRNIKEANKIYFRSEQDAIASGRTLSKLCAK